MQEQEILKLVNVEKKFPGTRALTKINLNILKGEVHAIIGENGAGKSTLMNIIGGLFPPTEGELYFDAEQISKYTPAHSQALGIGFVHQEISLCPLISVAENVYMNRAPKTKYGSIDFNKMNRDTLYFLEMFNSKINPNTKIKDLTIAQQQIVAIVKSISLKCKLLILDEPTSSLTEKESIELFDIIEQLHNQGISILYISHRLSEVMEICDRVTVLRDGEVVGTENICDTNTDRLISLMVGRTLSNIYPSKNFNTGNEILHARSLSGANGRFNNVTFSLYQGEILGFYGLVGAGRSELMKSICGLDSLDDGQVISMGKPVNNKSYYESISNGIVYMTEDRKNEGLFLLKSIKNNVSSSALNRVTDGIIINKNKEEELANKYIDIMRVKAPDSSVLCHNLSGGNQQKVLFAKSLAVLPKILIVDEPTRGIDVGARLEIYRLLRELCNQGIGIIMVTSDLSEAIGACDRVIVMYEGSITGEVKNEEIEQENIMRLASNIQTSNVN